jgi:uncharacterized protein YpmB
MVAKLVIGLFILVLIIGLAMALTFWYFNQRGARKHEKEMARMEQRSELDEQIVELAEEETENDIDAELERARNK